MELQSISEGRYQLPNDCKALVRGGVVYVCKKSLTQQYPRCRDCAHFQLGTAMYNQFNQTNICVKKPKDNKGYPNDAAAMAQKRYYAANAYARACDMYEPKIKQ